MAILNNSNAISSGGYDINNSLRFRSSASAYLSRTPASAPTDGKKLTLSCWVKRGILTGNYYIMQSGAGVGNDNYSSFYFKSDNTIQIGMYSVTPRVTTQVFRDASAWYHLVLAYDTTQATAGDRVKLYVNGTQVTAFTTNGTIPQNTLIAFTKQSQAVYIGTASDEATYYDGYMTEVNLIDGQALTPSSFGETDTTTGVWQPKAYTGTYGTNGFYLKFSDIATTSGSNAGLGKDFSGNANYWTTNNISVTAGITYDAMIDSPTLTSATVANYCVLNPLQKSTNVTLSNANLTWSTSGASAKVLSTIGMSSGKYYCEFTMASGNGNYGIATAQTGISGTNYLGNDTNSWCYAIDGNKYTNGSGAAYGATYTSGDIIGVAFDADAGTLTYYKNGSSQGTAFTGLTSGPYFFAQGADPSAGSVNFGQRPFAYTPPTGFVRLNTFNLPDSTIKKGNTVMDATTYTGDGASSRAITNAALFRPDFVWIKQRSGAEQHQAFDSIRGATKVLNPNLTNAESTDVTKLTAFNSNGFSLGSELAVNGSGSTYVGWQWQAGQGSTSSNTSGTITSTVSVNATAGFSVVTYTGTGANATVGHGLGVAPSWIIVKRRDTTGDWQVRHTSIAVANSIQLNSTAAAASATTVWNSTAPSSTVFSIGTSTDVNASAGTYVAYCWAEIAGFSKFGSYTGNGVNGNGPFVYCGFRPKFVMFKNTNTTQNWIVMDTARDTKNKMTQWLFANTSGAEYTDANIDVDFVSNGFKIRTSIGTEINGNGNSIIFAAYAENPFKNANAR